MEEGELSADAAEPGVCRFDCDVCRCSCQCTFAENKCHTITNGLKKNAMKYKPLLLGANMSTGALFHDEMSETTVRFCYIERVLARWWRLVAFVKATNLLHRAMLTVSYRRLSTDIEMACKVGTCCITVSFAVALAATGAIQIEQSIVLSKRIAQRSIMRGRRSVMTSKDAWKCWREEPRYILGKVIS